MLECIFYERSRLWSAVKRSSVSVCCTLWTGGKEKVSLLYSSCTLVSSVDAVAYWSRKDREDIPALIVWAVSSVV